MRAKPVAWLPVLVIGVVWSVAGCGLTTPPVRLDGVPSSVTASGVPMQSPAPTPVSGSIPSAHAASAGDQGGLRWTVLGPDAWPPSQNLNALVHRASGGYLGAAFDGRRNVVTIVVSDDGRSWSSLPEADGALHSSSDARVTIVSGIAERGGTMVVAGSEALDDMSAGDARAWSSADGSHWRMTTDADVSDASMEAVAAGRDGFVAVGSDGFPGASVQLPGARGASAWVSSDGTTWTRAPAQAAFGDSIMTGVIGTDDGYVAWGEAIPGASHAPMPPVWTSADGLGWARRAVEGRVSSPEAPFAQVVAVPGALVAVGRVGSPAGDGSDLAAAWTSIDAGATWRLARVDPVAADGGASWMRSVAFDGSTLLAVGETETGSTAVWRSADLGSTWARAAIDPSFAPATVTLVIAVPGGFAVFGEDDAAGTDVKREWVVEP
jgi:hypothetical protein